MADTGIFYATEADLLRNPPDQFLTLYDGIWIDTDPLSIGPLKTLLGMSPTDHVFAHNPWDWQQVWGFGYSKSPFSDAGTPPSTTSARSWPARTPGTTTT